VSYVVDTHYLLWSLIDPSHVPGRTVQILMSPQSTKYVSKISLWEIALKYTIGKLKLEGVTPEEVLQTSVESGYEILDVSEEYIASSYKLPFIENHRDPFDRLLVWQCIRNSIVLLTADKRLKGYERYGLKIAA